MNTGRIETSSNDQIYEINTHLLYELKWMIYAAARFAKGDHDGAYVALIDSATVHARNLFEFADKRTTDYFTLRSLGGKRQKSTEWNHWANNRVTHMHLREHEQAPWPNGLNNGRPDRLMVMAAAVLERLETGGESIPAGPVRTAFDTMVGAARAYWNEPTEQRHQDMNALYDGSRDYRPY